MANTQEEYVLGTGDDELSRLGIQHRVWADAAVAAWKKAGIGPGSRVIDLGCGPGHATFDMAQLVMSEGRVLAVDESNKFMTYLNDQAKTRGLSQIHTALGDAQNLRAAIATADGENFQPYDAIYCRWVLCWLENPELAVKEMAAAIRPGGKIVIHDYFNWISMGIGPRSEAMEIMVRAAVKSFEEHHGNVDIAAHLPSMLRAAGLKINHFDVHLRVARGGGEDSTLAWPLTWWRSYGPKLVASGRLSAETYAQAAKDMDVLERDPDRFYYCPPVFEFIAEKA